MFVVVFGADVSRETFERLRANNQWSGSRLIVTRIGCDSGSDTRKGQAVAGVFDGNVSRETFPLCQFSSGERKAQGFRKERDSESCTSLKLRTRALDEDARGADAGLARSIVRQSCGNGCLSSRHQIRNERESKA
jgi:hypothetical protein